jgi:hypothetical protein
MPAEIVEINDFTNFVCGYSWLSFQALKFGQNNLPQNSREAVT